MPDPIRVDPREAAAAAVPLGASADEVSAWWASLSQAARNWLIAEHPPELGNLNGIPGGTRDTINTAVVNDDLNVSRTPPAATA